MKWLLVMTVSMALMPSIEPYFSTIVLRAESQKQCEEMRITIDKALPEYQGYSYKCIEMLKLENQRKEKDNEI